MKNLKYRLEEVTEYPTEKKFKTALMRNRVIYGHKGIDLLTEEKPKLYRVVALRDIHPLSEDSENPVCTIKAGSVGGYVFNETSLSQKGECWLIQDAIVFPAAHVEGDAFVRGNAVIEDEATVTGRATVFDNAVISGNAVITGNATVYGHAHVGDAATVCERASVSGYAYVLGAAVVTNNAKICDHACVYGQVADSAVVGGDTHVADTVIVRGDYTNLSGSLTILSGVIGKTGDVACAGPFPKELFYSKEHLSKNGVFPNMVKIIGRDTTYLTMNFKSEQITFSALENRSEDLEQLLTTVSLRFRDLSPTADLELYASYIAFVKTLEAWREISATIHPLTLANVIEQL